MIHLFCRFCKSSAHLEAKRCPKCEAPFVTDRKYRVTVKAQDGRRVTKVVDSLDTAKKLEANLKTKAVEHRLLGIRESILMSELWDKYLPWARCNKKSWRTDQVLWDKHIAPLLSRKTLDSVTPFDIQKVLDKLRQGTGRKYSDKTVLLVLTTVKRVINWGIEMDLYRGDNPAKRIKTRRPNNERVECLTREEIARLLDVLSNWPNQRLALLVHFALMTGLRRGELFKLKWKDVDLGKGFITLIDPKGGKDVTLPINDKAREILAKAREELPEGGSEQVFPNRDGEMRQYFGNSWKAIKRKARLPEKFRFHGLRHTFASYIASSGEVDLYVLQRLLNHRSTQMTQRYAHLFDRRLLKGANIIAREMNTMNDYC